MNGRRGVTGFGLMLAVGLLSGCATGKKERMAMLEQANRNLTDQLNRANGDLESAYRDRDELEKQLLAANRSAEDLRAMLAEMETSGPAAPAGWTAVPGGGMIAIEDGVLFAPGKIVLREEAQRALDAVASTLQGEYANKDVLVFGHTDDQPIKKSGWKDNWQLSTERSLAVVRFLRDRGLAAERLVGAGCGEHRPRVGNSSASNRTSNRRVEVYAIDPELLRAR